MPTERSRSGDHSRARLLPRSSARVAAYVKHSRGKPLTSVLVIVIAGTGLAVVAAGAAGPGGFAAAAIQRFLLLYSGMFALIALTVAVAVGLITTDRIIMSPGGRITAQAIHRAILLGTVGFLVIHITLEVVAARSQLADSVVPFLARPRTLHIGLGTVASDLILVVAATRFLRSRVARLARAWWRQGTHTLVYLAWPLAIVHGPPGGRAAGSYADWSYGACIGAVAMALGVRAIAMLSRQEPAPAEGPPGHLAKPAAQDGTAPAPQVRPGPPGYADSGAPDHSSHERPAALPRRRPAVSPHYRGPRQ